MRRKKGALVPLEEDILSMASQMRDNGDGEFYGYTIASRMGDKRKAQRGTIYKALQRLEQWGYLLSRWEDLPEGTNRPRRRIYKLVDNG